MRLEALSDAELAGMLDLLSDLRHDLGKYVRFETRFVEAGEDVEALRAALRADLLATRRRGDEIESAVSVWARLRPAALEGDPDVDAIDTAMARLATADLGGPEEALRAAARWTAEVAEATRRLLARARARVGER